MFCVPLFEEKRNFELCSPCLVIKFNQEEGRPNGGVKGRVADNWSLMKLFATKIADLKLCF